MIIDHNQFLMLWFIYDISKLKIKMENLVDFKLIFFIFCNLKYWLLLLTKYNTN